MPSHNYPSSVQEMLRPNATFKPEAVRALYAFKAKKTFKLTDAERFEAMKELVADLSAAYGIPTPSLSLQPGIPSAYYVPGAHSITLSNLSIITMLHEFRHAVKGSDEREAVRWSVNLFKKVFPKQFERLQFSGHMCYRAQQ